MPIDAQSNEAALASTQIGKVVDEVLATTPIIDIHTHLYSPELGKLVLWGIDELLTYHYLEAEFFRCARVTPAEYFQFPKKEKAERIWQTLFVERSPISEATRGVIAVLRAFGLPTGKKALGTAREFFLQQTLEAHVQNVFRLAGISCAVMTNDPLDPEEAPLWMKGVAGDARFPAVLRLDRILYGWTEHWKILARQGYQVDEQLGGKSIAEIRRFLTDWHERMRPVYMAVSLTDEFQYPDESMVSKILGAAVLPACRELRLPMSLMVGVRRQVNPALRLAGDGAGRVDLRAVEYLCREFPENRFLVSVLSRENQHELCVYARKFGNLRPFGCWWFLNNMSIVEEISRERIEMLGTSFIPQHSDARVLEQVIYKWRNTRKTIGKVLAESYRLLADDGRAVTRSEIQKDVERLFRGNFAEWVEQTLP